MRSENDPEGQKKRSFIEQARRAQIIEAAVEVIAEAGFAGASLAQIARHAGISKGVISYHFSSKHELMEEVVTQVYAEAVAAVAERLEGVTSATDLLRTQIVGGAEHMKANRDHVRALGEVFNHLRDAEGRPRYGIHTSEPLYQALEQIYAYGQETGEFRDFDRRVAAVCHSAAMDSMFAYWIAHPDHDLDAHARQLADLFIHATRREPE